MKYLFLLVALFVSHLSRADEGMWTLNGFPKDQVKKAHGFEVTDQWLDKVRLSSARLAGGCSGSFVSSTGLVMTNHHCIEDCVEQLSSNRTNYLEKGFYAKSAKEEVRCPEVEVNRLLEIKDVTPQISKVTGALKGAAYNEALKGEMSKIEKECSAGSDKTRCEVVTLYHGGQYNLYRYERYQDVRLVFAPEISIAFFGGDPDNFMFPRYNLDSAFLRVYENNQPLKNAHFFNWSTAPAKDGDLSFVTGHPGRTSRLWTVSELKFERDVRLVRALIHLSELRGLLTEFQKRGPEQKRTAGSKLFGIENAVKAMKGRQQALVDENFFASKVKAERELIAQLKKQPAKWKELGGAWNEIAKAQRELEEIFIPLTSIEQNNFQSKLYEIAKTLVRASDELAKPNEKRFREFADARLPQLKQELFSTAPIHEDLEIALMTFALTKVRENLTPDHPFVKKLLGKQSPQKLAESLIKGTKLKDVKVRKALFEGGQKAIAASNDPLIKFYRTLDADARAIRKRYEDDIEPIIKKSGENVAKAQFAVRGTGTYPDATFTLRISYGQIKGYEQNGTRINPLTTIAGVFDRHTGSDPFALPASWLKAESKLNSKTPLNFVSTNDIIGGNSGSPVINKQAEIIGLIFDGNIQSLGGAYGFNQKVNRAVAVHSSAIIEALRKVYGAGPLADELTTVKK